MTDINWKDKSAFLGQKSCWNEERKERLEAEKWKYCIVESIEGRAGV